MSSGKGRTPNGVKGRALKLFALAASVALCACWPTAARQGGAAAAVERGSLEEVRGKRAMMLVVGRSFSVDARAPGGVSDEDVRTALANARPRHSLSAYRHVGAKLNEYIRKYHSMASVESPGEADFFVVFEIMREHSSLIDGRPVTYGKLFVVTRGAAGRPRLLWESRGEMSLAEDAAGELIRALKEVRGER